MRKAAFFLLLGLLAGSLMSQSHFAQFTYIRLVGNDTQPACSSSTRGMFWFTNSALGVADLVEVCRKNALDSYAWTVLSLL